MSRNIKIELELPEFEKELSITVNLRRDGEGLTVLSTPSETKTVISNQSNIPPVWKQQAPQQEPPRGGSFNSGNLMNMNF